MHAIVTTETSKFI